MKNLFHIHWFKPIVSRYISFSTRDIIYECRCGKKKAKQITKDFSDRFPIETNMMMDKAEFNEILNS